MPRATKLEEYKVLVLSTAHLGTNDIIFLNLLSRDNDEWMVMSREPGYFIKLHEDLNDNKQFFISHTMEKIIKFAHDNDYRMIEFDRDGPIVTLFQQFVG